LRREHTGLPAPPCPSWNSLHSCCHAPKLMSRNFLTLFIIFGLGSESFHFGPPTHFLVNGSQFSTILSHSGQPSPPSWPSISVIQSTTVPLHPQEHRTGDSRMLMSRFLETLLNIHLPCSPWSKGTRCRCRCSFRCTHARIVKGWSELHSPR
jgi:hypothetical protein